MKTKQHPSHLGGISGEQDSFRYNGIAKTFHWLMAVLIIVMIGYGWTLDGKQGTALSTALSYHALGGLLVLGLVVLRLSWRIAHPPPRLPDSLNKAQKVLAHSVHVLLYGLMVIVPLTGLIAATSHPQPIILMGSVDLQTGFSFLGQGNFNLKRELHAQTIHLLEALILAHIGGALLHHFKYKDAVMDRMLFK